MIVRWIKNVKASGASRSRLRLLVFLSDPCVDLVPGEARDDAGRGLRDARRGSANSVEYPGGRGDRRGARQGRHGRGLLLDRQRPGEGPRHRPRRPGRRGEDRFRQRQENSSASPGTHQDGRKDPEHRVTVADRSELSKDMLLGSRNLDGFLVKPNEERLTSPDSPRQ